LKRERRPNSIWIISCTILLAILCSQLSILDANVKAASSLSLTIVKTNHWQEGGKTRSQFSVAIDNDGSSGVTGWTISIPVPEGTSMGVSDGWNGTFSLSGTTLTITPKDYNNKIAAGAGISDIGFILTTNKAVELTGTITTNGASGETTVTGVPVTSEPQTSSGTTPVDISGASPNDDWLHTDGNKIVDANGTEVWLTGINWFGYNTGTNIFDGVWGCNMREALAAIADRGFNLLRIPISSELALQWKSGEYPAANYNQAYNPELAGLNSLEIFELVMQICKENGIKVMIDIHCADTDSMGHMKNLWYSDSISTQDFYDSLTFLADIFKSDDTVIAFDLKNEPHGKPGEEGAIWNDSTSKYNWKYVAETAGNLILDINPHVLIMIEGIEIYPKDIVANGDFASTDAEDYYFNWWGGNLRGVKDDPIDFGSAERNAQIVYSPHDYGPAVYAQPWFEGEFSYESLQTDCWNDNWLFITKDNIAPVLIGEWGGYMSEPNLTWMTYMRQLIAEYRLHHTFWCFNANSGDTGGLVKDDFTTWDEEKYAFVKEVLWQEDDKFVGLDHVIPLGASGYGVALSAISGAVDTTDDQDGTPTPTGSDTTPLDTDPSVTDQVGSIVPGDPEDQNQSASNWPSGDIVIAIVGGIIMLAAIVGVGYYSYRTNRSKKDGEHRDA
jgi:endoglucanase